MHRINSTSVGWNQSEGIIFLEQTPAPVVFITAADTDIQTLAAAFPKLPPTFPGLRVANLLLLQQQISIDTYSEQVLELAQVIILRLLGGRSYWAYGLEVVQEIVQRTGTNLIVMPGDDALDPELMSQSTLPVGTVNQIWQYFHEGGVENAVNALKFISDTCLATAYNPPPAQPVPRVGLYDWGMGTNQFKIQNSKFKIKELLETRDKGDKVDKIEFFPQSPVPSPQSPIPSPQSPVPSPQSPIPSPQSPVPSPKSGYIVLSRPLSCRKYQGD